MYDSGYRRGGVSIKRERNSIIWRKRGGVNPRTSGNSSLHVKPISWSLNELTEGAVTIVAGSLSQNSPTRIEKDDYDPAEL